MLHYVDIFPKFNAPPETDQPQTLGEQPCVHPSARIYDSHLGAWTDIGPNSLIAESTFADYSYTAGDVWMIYSQVGKFCSIASHVRINPGNHPMERVTQHHMTYRRKQFGFGDSDDGEFFEWRRAHQCVVGHDVWMGHGALIMAGVKIGTGAVIGAGSVVTKEIMPYEVAVGVPALPIRKRFSDDVIERLLAIGWWDWDRAKLETAFDDLRDVQAFIEKYS